MVTLTSIRNIAALLVCLSAGISGLSSQASVLPAAKAVSPAEAQPCAEATPERLVQVASLGDVAALETLLDGDSGVFPANGGL